MKIQTRTLYESPAVKAVEVNPRAIICQSIQNALNNESYEEGSISGWF